MTEPTASTDSLHAEVHGNVGQLLAAQRLTIYQHVDRVLAAHVLDGPEITWQQALYATPPDDEYIAQQLRERGAVALVAEPGNGRRITAINLLARAGTQPSEVTPDPEDPGSLITELGRGYIFNADDLGTDVNAKQRAAVLRLLDTARSARCLVVLRVTRQVWQRLALEEHAPAISLRPANGIAIFRNHLSQQRTAHEAEQWSQLPEIIARGGSVYLGRLRQITGTVHDCPAVWLALILKRPSSSPDRPLCETRRPARVCMKVSSRRLPR